MEYRRCFPRSFPCNSSTSKQKAIYFYNTRREGNLGLGIPPPSLAPTDDVPAHPLTQSTFKLTTPPTCQQMSGRMDSRRRRCDHSSNHVQILKKKSGNPGTSSRNEQYQRCPLVRFHRNRRTTRNCGTTPSRSYYHCSGQGSRHRRWTRGLS